ncbi:MAG: hypothetical protein R3F34_12020 [Planctomycetota bacterium]
MDRARRQRARAPGPGQQLDRPARQHRETVELRRVEPRVRHVALSLAHAQPRTVDADDARALRPQDRVRRRSALARDDVGGPWRLELDTQVDAVEDRPREPVPIAQHRAGRVAAAPRRVTEVAARTGVRGSDELEARGQLALGSRAHDRHGPRLERLSQRLDRLPSELRELVEEQDAEVRARDLAGDGRIAAAHESHLTRGVVRRAPRTRGDESLRPLTERGDEACEFDALVERQRREQLRERPREECLARSRRSGEQQSVRARRRDFERLLADLLPGDGGEPLGSPPHRGRRVERQRALLRRREQRVEHAREIARAHRPRAGEVRRLAGRARRRDDLAETQRARGVRRRESARDVHQSSVDAELADEESLRDPHRIEVSRRRRGGHREGEVEVLPALAHPRRLEVHDEAPRRESEPRRLESAEDAALALAQDGIRQAREHDVGRSLLAGVEARLDPDGLGARADETDAVDACRGHGAMTWSAREGCRRNGGNPSGAARAGGATRATFARLDPPRAPARPSWGSTRAACGYR